MRLKRKLYSSHNKNNNSNIVQDSKGDCYLKVRINVMGNQGPVNHKNHEFVGFDEKGEYAYYRIRNTESKKKNR